MGKKIVLFVVSILVVSGSSFYGGMKYSQSKNINFNGKLGANFSNLTEEQRQSRMGQFGEGVNRAGQGIARANGGMISGEIIAKDDQSITVKLQDGSSKIIFFSSSAKIAKSSTGTSDDLFIGVNVFVNGSTNQDGSVTAQNIQVR